MRRWLQGYRYKHERRSLNLRERRSCVRVPQEEIEPAGGIFLFGIEQADFGGNAAHFTFVQIAHGKKRVCQLRLCQPVQKVALVLAGVAALEQPEHTGMRLPASRAGHRFPRAGFRSLILKDPPLAYRPLTSKRQEAELGLRRLSWCGG